MPNKEPENTGNPLDNTPDPLLERDMLELKLRAELGMLDSYSSGDMPPELQQMFLQQVYDFEKNFAEGTCQNFAETLSLPAFDPWPEDGFPWEEGEAMVNKVLQWYRDQNVEVSFEFDYPSSIKYDFLTALLPGKPNYYGKVPEVPVVVFYEEFFPNHAADIEVKATKFMEAFFSRDAEAMKDVIWRDQISPEKGPYDGLLLIEYFEKWFATLSDFEKHDFSILETSYEWYDDYDDNEPATETVVNHPTLPAGMGYAEGMVGYIAQSLLQTEPIRKVGPFKLYFEWRDGHWGIIYPLFPGLSIPPEG